MPVTLSPDDPRAQLQRAAWIGLDGEWEFAFDRGVTRARAAGVRFDRTIRVPFAPEAPLSGIGAEAFTCAAWDRRSLEPPPLAPGERLVLRFGAVDYQGRPSGSPAAMRTSTPPSAATSPTSSPQKGCTRSSSAPGTTRRI